MKRRGSGATGSYLADALMRTASGNLVASGARLRWSLSMFKFVPHCDCIGTSDEDDLCLAAYKLDVQEAIEKASEVSDLLSILPKHLVFRVDL